MNVHLSLKFDEDASYEDMKKMDEMVNGWLDRFKEIVDRLAISLDGTVPLEVDQFIPAKELAAAEMRLSQLDALEEKCNWSSPCPTPDEQDARDRWQRIMDVQGEFESKYC